MNDIERLYREYGSSDRKDKPGLARALDLLAGHGYVSKREDLAETIKKSLIDHDGLDTTADMADCISADVINKFWRL